VKRFSGASTAALTRRRPALSVAAMEGLFILTALTVVGGWILGIAGYIRAGAARRDARALRAEIAALRGEVAGMAGAMVAAGFRPPEAAPAPQPSAAPPWAGAAPQPAEAPDPVPAQSAPGDDAPPPWAGRAPAAAAAIAPDAGPATEAAAPPPWTSATPDRPRQSLEELITQRWGVWLGAGALMLAAVFLVRLAVEEGWLGPGLRSIAAALLGVALVVAGEWLARRPAKGEGLPDLAPAALAAGGVAALFGAAYAATVLYGLLPPLVGFVLMAAAGVFGLLLSLRRGPLVAAVGLAGAFVTPALVASEDPSLVGLFAYLAVVTAAAMAVVRVTAWGWLGWCAVVAGALWVLVGTVVAEHGELWAPAAFVPMAAAIFLLALPREALATGLGRALAHLPPVALGLALLPVTFGDTDIAPPLGVLMLSAVAILAAQRRDPELRRLPWIAAGLGLLALLVWVVPAWSPTGERVTIEGAVQAIIPGAWVPEALVRFLVLCAAFALLHLLAGLALEARGGGNPGLGRPGRHRACPDAAGGLCAGARARHRPDLGAGGLRAGGGACGGHCPRPARGRCRARGRPCSGGHGGAGAQCRDGAARPVADARGRDLPAAARDDRGALRARSVAARGRGGGDGGAGAARGEPLRAGLRLGRLAAAERAAAGLWRAGGVLLVGRAHLSRAQRRARGAAAGMRRGAVRDAVGAAADPPRAAGRRGRRAALGLRRGRVAGDRAVCLRLGGGAAAPARRSRGAAVGGRARRGRRGWCWARCCWRTTPGPPTRISPGRCC
jgi:hypothetical protein